MAIRNKDKYRRFSEARGSLKTSKRTPKRFAESPVVKDMGLNFRATRSEIKKYERLSKQVEVIRDDLSKKIVQYEDKDNLMAKNPLTIHFKPAKNIPIERLESRRAFTRKLGMLEQYVKPDFFVTRANVYRSNIKDSLRKVYNSDANQLIGKIDKLTPEQLQWLLLRHPNDFSIDFIYLEELTGKQNLAFLDSMVEQALDLKNLNLGK